MVKSLNRDLHKTYMALSFLIVLNSKITNGMGLFKRDEQPKESTHYIMKMGQSDNMFRVGK